MLPISIQQALLLVSEKQERGKKTDWMKFIRVASAQDSDLFIAEATNGVMALTVAYSNPQYADWGGSAWMLAEYLMQKEDATEFLTEEPPKDYPSNVQDVLKGWMSSAKKSVDVQISARYWDVITQVLTVLGARAHGMHLLCGSDVGPLQITIAGTPDDLWLEVTIHLMGLRR